MLSASTLDDIFLGVTKIGFCGVDLFFVLSGFLITRILLKAKGSSNYFKGFYGRRLVRIFPLYYAFLLCAFFVFPSAFGITPKILDHQAWYWLYLSNFLHIYTDDAVTFPLAIT